MRWKKFTQALPYVVCTQVRRHVHKRIRKRRYGEENPGRFVFQKLVLFNLSLGLTTPSSSGILVWNFYQTFVTASIEFWLRFEPQVRPTRLAINLLFVTAKAERKVCLCVKLFDFVRGGILIRLTWKFSLFVPNSVEILGWNFRKKIIPGEFFRNFVQTKAIIPLPDIRHCVYWVLAEVWAPDSSHKICNKSFIRHCLGWKEGSYVCETVWFFSWVYTHPFALKFVAFCPKFSVDSWVEFHEKTIPGEFFRNFVQTNAILYRNLWNSRLISAISFFVRIALKKIRTGTFVCCLHPGKEVRP